MLAMGTETATEGTKGHGGQRKGGENLLHRASRGSRRTWRRNGGKDNALRRAADAEIDARPRVIRSTAGDIQVCCQIVSASGYCGSNANSTACAVSLHHSTRSALTVAYGADSPSANTMDCPVLRSTKWKC